MADLIQFIIEHTERGECQCGKCFDKGTKPDPTGHTVDIAFFKVSLNKGDATEKELFSQFLELSLAWQSDEPLDPFDGLEHNYIDLGAWLGDQGLALQYMALGTLLRAFKLMTPRTMLGQDIDDQLVQQLAGAGLVTINSHVATYAH